MKTSKAKKTRTRPAKEKMALIERKLPYRKFAEFPQMKGRTVERIEIFTLSNTHSLTIYFQDKTFLNLLIEPSLSIASRFSDGRGDEKVLKRWPVIRSISEKD